MSAADEKGPLGEEPRRDPNDECPSSADPDAGASNPPRSAGYQSDAVVHLPPVTGNSWSGVFGQVFSRP
jgi:hypothetical protein